MDEFYQKAYGLIASPAARKAFDIGSEPDKIRDAYGRTGVGQGCLLARRLIESGVRLGYRLSRRLRHSYGAREADQAAYDGIRPGVSRVA